MMLQVISPIDLKTKKITAPREIMLLDKNTNIPSIFLAGPCPRSDYEDDWRTEAIQHLQEGGFNGIVFNPTNPLYSEKDPDALKKQTIWELSAMECSDFIIFWVARDEKHPAPTTNIELGQFLRTDAIDNILIGIPDFAVKTEYIKIRLELLDKKYINNLKTLMLTVIEECEEIYANR